MLRWLVDAQTCTGCGFVTFNVFDKEQRLIHSQYDFDEKRLLRHNIRLKIYWEAIVLLLIGIIIITWNGRQTVVNL